MKRKNPFLFLLVMMLIMTFISCAGGKYSRKYKRKNCDCPTFSMTQEQAPEVLADGTGR